MKLNYKRTILVGFAFFLISLFWMAYDAIIPVILINKFGMNHKLSGSIMALDNILAVFLLPVFGAMSDKCVRNKFGKRMPFITIGTVLAAVLLIGLTFADQAQLNNISAVSTIDDPVAMQTIYETQGDKELKTPEGKAFVLSETFTLEEFTKIPCRVKAVKTSDPLRILRKNDSALDCQERDVILLNEVFTQQEFDAVLGKISSKSDKECLQLIYNNQLPITVLGGAGYVCLSDLDEATINNLPNLLDAKDIDACTTDVTHPDYINYVTPARQAYAADATTKAPLALIMFIVLLLGILISMSIFRSPAVALMPDVTIKPLRSKGNAVINLMGTIGGIIVLVLGLVMKTSDAKNALMSYTGYFAIIAGIMLVALSILLLTVRERKWAKEMEETSLRLGIEEETEDTKEKRSLSKGEKRSLIFILLSVALWYIGYNAVTSMYSVYATNILDMDYNFTMLVAQGFAIAAYIPAGIIASKIGRKKTILAGVVMLTAAFAMAIFARSNTSELVMNVIFALAGIGWATINVNSFPMAVEMCSGGDIGKYTGYYYTASMTAQIITPILSGFLMDSINELVLFPYATVFAGLAFVTMLFVRHGDAKPAAKKGLEALDIDD